MTTKPGGSVVLGPHGAETLMFSGNGVKDFALETTVWHRYAAPWHATAVGVDARRGCLHWA